MNATDARMVDSIAAMAAIGRIRERIPEIDRSSQQALELVRQRERERETGR